MRETLINLLKNGHEHYYDEEYKGSDVYDAIAEHLIAHGVTLGKDTDVPTTDAPDNNVGWISVKERLPDKDGDYLALERLSMGHSMLSIAGFARKGESASKIDLQGERNVWYSIDDEWGYFSIDSITHWMPLPELPKEEA